MADGGYRVEVHGSVGGNLVVGDHNLIVNAQTGSSVTVLQEAQRPKPQRRPSVRILPRRPPWTFGRDAELGRIAAAVVAQSSIQVYGPSGMGKSTLLRRAAYDLADETDGLVFLSVSGRNGEDVLQEIFEACYETSGYRPSTVEMRRLMAGIRACVLADDLVATPDALSMILDTVPDTAFVFSSPDRELWGQGQTLELAGLPAEAAINLVRQEFGRDLSSVESAAVLDAWRSTGGSPMGLLRVAAGLSRGGSTQVTEPIRVVAIIETLTPRQRDVYELLRAAPTARASVPVIARLAGAPDMVRAEAAAEVLVHAGLVDWADDTYRIAADLASEPATPTYRRDIVTLIEAMLSWLADGDVRPRDVARHAELIIAFVDEAVAAGYADAGCRLARAAAATLALSLRWGAWRDLLMSGQAAATACGDQEALAYFTHERGIRMLCLGQAAAAAAVLASAAAMWHALGLTHSAALATQAQAIAGGAGVPPITPHPPAPAPHPPAPQPHPPAPHPQPISPSSPIVGRATVQPKPSGFPVSLVATIVAIVAVLIVAAILVVPRITGRAGAKPTPSIPISISPTPTPIAFSDMSAPNANPNLVLDNDPRTIWSSRISQTSTVEFWIGIDMGNVANRTGLSVTPRTPILGFPDAFRIESSLDGLSWTLVPGQNYDGNHPYKPAPGPQVFTFDPPVQARYIRLVAYSLGAIKPTTEGVRRFVFQLAEMHVLGR